MINNWGMNEDLAQNAADGLEAKVFGFLEVRAFHSEVPAQKDIQSIIGTETFSRYYSLGWASILVLAEGLNRAKATGNLSGPGLKVALETLTDFETGGLTPPITYTAEDHRPTTQSWLYTIKDGRLLFVAETGIERTVPLLGW